MVSPLISRQAAGLLPARRVTRTSVPTMLTAHYLGESPWRGADRSSSARFEATTEHARCATLWRGVQAYHYRPGNNASDVYYNSMVCGHGYRFEGRGPGVQTGANGTAEGNRRSYAVLYLAGAGDPVTEAAARAMLDEETRYRVPILRDHSKWKPTACGGDALRGWIAAGKPVNRPPVKVDSMTIRPGDPRQEATDDLSELLRFWIDPTLPLHPETFEHGRMAWAAEDLKKRMAWAAPDPSWIGAGPNWSHRTFITATLFAAEMAELFPNQED